MKNNILFLFAFFCVPILWAQNTDVFDSNNVETQSYWIENQLSTMTLDEKIGQLFMVQAYSNKDEAHAVFIEKLINEYKIGGLIFMQGTPENQVKLTNRYQAQSKVPLLIGFDGEWGLDMRLENSYRFPWNMTLGAIRDNSLLEELGAQIAKHCKRVGIHINFAPVVDINTNPENPIIGNRSFGENKYNVTQKALAFIKGMEKEGVIANAKHFPGHGDTATDSHKTLPVIEYDFERIDSVELYPFKQLINNNLKSIMVAHLNVEALENNSVPTSLSYKVITNLLKEELQFNGLILTDALNMKGASNYAKPGEVDLAAFLAGNDILLIPEDVPAAVKKIKNAIETNKISIERLNYSVKKILLAKYWVGLHNFQPISLDNLNNDLNTIYNEVLHRKLVENSVTLLKNEDFIFPVKKLESKRIAYVKLGDADGSNFLKMLQNYTHIDEVSSENLDEILEKLKPYNTVIIGYHKSNANPWKNYKFSNKELVWLYEIARKNNVLLSVFASPYSLLDITTFQNINGVLMAYQNSELAQEIAAQMIFGAVEAKGKLPVTIKNEFGEGHGFITTPINRLGYSVPEAVGMSSAKLGKIDSIMQTVLVEKMAPGAQVLVARKGKVIYNKSFGYFSDSTSVKVENSHLYDVASLTKILATLPLIMELEESKEFKLETTLGHLLPKLKKTDKKKITVKQALSHFGGLYAWIPFYKFTLDSLQKPDTQYYSNLKNKDFSLPVANKLFITEKYSDSIFDRIAKSELYPKNVYKYSDLPFYLFKFYIEDFYNDNLNNLTQNHFYKSLGANRTTYLPLDIFNLSEIVPTEIDNYFRYQTIHGYVHDMGAAMQGGIGGHAGLFSNANDVAKIMQMYLQKGYYGGKRFFQTETIDKFNKRYFSDFKVRKGIGFDKPQINKEEKATCDCVSDSSFGHSGFTGTYTWADPESEIVYVFLSNRTYPTAENKGLVNKNIRTQIQKIIQEAIVE